MSFGYSVGDAVMLLQLARRTYRNCKEAGGEYIEIAREVKSLYSVLKTVRGEAKKPGQTLFQPGSRTAVEIIALTDGCKGVLDEVSVLLAEHKGLAPEGEDMGAGKKLWHRLKFGNKIEELGKVRHKIITYTSAIAVLLDTIHLKITGRVETKVEAGFAEILNRFEDMRRTILEIATKTRTAQRSGSVTSIHSVLSLTTYTDDDKEVWRRFRTELIARGFHSDALDRHMDVLKAYMLRLNQSGILDEAVIAELPGGVNTSWWTRKEFVVTATSIQMLDPDHEAATGSTYPSESLLKQSPDLFHDPMLTQTPPRGAEPNMGATSPNGVRSTSSGPVQAIVAEPTNKGQPAQATEVPRTLDRSSWGRDFQRSTTATEIAIEKCGIQSNDAGENSHSPHNELSKTSPITETIEPYEIRHQRPPITESQTLNLPTSYTTSLGLASSSRPTPRLTKSANNTYDPRKYIPQANIIASSDTGKAESLATIRNVALIARRAANGNDTSEPNENVAAAIDVNDLGHSCEDAASWQKSPETTFSFNRVTAEPDHGLRGQEEKMERSWPPNPTAESYFSDVVSTSSHSTLLRPVNSNTKSSKTALRRSLSPHVESHHTDDTISHSSHYAVRPFPSDRRPTGLSVDFDSGTDISNDLDDLEPPYRYPMRQNDVGPDSNARMQRVHAWATGIQPDVASTSNATEPRSIRSLSLNMRANRSENDGSVVSHNSTITSRTSGPSKIQQAARAALLAGASQAFRAVNEPGKWDQEKGKGVISAALDAGGIRDEAVRNVVQQFIAGITSPSGPASSKDDEKPLPAGGSSTTRSSIAAERTKDSRRPKANRRRTFDSAAERFENRSRSRARVIPEYSNDWNSSDEEKADYNSKSKRHVKTGLAVVSTIHALHNVYKAYEGREARRKAVEEGELSPEEARKLKTKATLQDAASIGVASLAIKGALSNWREASQ